MRAGDEAVEFGIDAYRSVKAADDAGGVILWGQRRISPRFQKFGEGPDFLRGEKISDIADLIRSNDISVDTIPIHYFIDSQGRKIAVNNRGLAAIRMAGKEPTNLVEVIPTADELSRLDDLPIDRYHLIPGDRIAVTESKVHAEATHLYTVIIPD